jgi:DNA primase
MGHEVSDDHCEILARAKVERITLLMDGDKAGRDGVTRTLTRLASRFFVKVALLPEGTQPDTADRALLSQLVAL